MKNVMLASALLLAACQGNRVEQGAGEIPKSARAGDGSIVTAEPVLERPTLRSLGVYWIITGDNNKNATVALSYRKRDGVIKKWEEAPDLLRVQKGAHDRNDYNKRQENSKLAVPQDAWLFAGSALMLQPDTAYDLRLTLKDPDGGTVTRTVQSRTIAEPVAPKNMTTLYVVPGSGGGDGSQANPFKGLQAADAAAKPNTRFLLKAGTYAPLVFKSSGEPGRPIIYQPAGDGEVIVEGKGKETNRAMDLSGLHDVWLEKLTVRNANAGIVGHEGARLVIRRCRITGCEYGIHAVVNKEDKLKDLWISDNTLLGPSTWPRAHGIENARGIQVSGAGHVVCYNYVKGYADAIDTYQGPRVEAIDFHNNDVELLTDDGIEMDFSERNTRCFENRLTNAFQGISVQPIYGGPVYIFRNTIYNIGVEPYKIHNSPSGVLMFHNTTVKQGIPQVVMAEADMHNFVVKNNLFVGTPKPDGSPSKYAIQMDLRKITETDWDYNGYAGGPWETFMRWQSPNDYKTIEEVRKNGPVEKHAVIIRSPNLFANGVKPPANLDVEQKPQDLRLAPNTEAIDAGVPLKGFGYKGKAPDLGAHELGEPAPHYGPRPERK
jgi:hypothetical protein